MILSAHDAPMSGKASSCAVGGRPAAASSGRAGPSNAPPHSMPSQPQTWTSLRRLPAAAAQRHATRRREFRLHVLPSTAHGGGSRLWRRRGTMAVVEHVGEAAERQREQHVGEGDRRDEDAHLHAAVASGEG
eukprot:7383068-Prymnesium_polylepis.1